MVSKFEYLKGRTVVFFNPNLAKKTIDREYDIGYLPIENKFVLTPTKNPAKYRTQILSADAFERMLRGGRDEDRWLPHILLNEKQFVFFYNLLRYSHTISREDRKYIERILEFAPSCYHVNNIERLNKIRERYSKFYLENIK